MATSSDIQEVFGISARTIETWSATRDEKYLLARFLKSYGKHDLAARLYSIVEEENIKVIDKADFIKDLSENISLLLSDLPANYKIEIGDREGRTRGLPDIVVRSDDTYYAINEVSQLPSKNNIMKNYCNKLVENVHNSNNDFFKGIEQVQVLFLTSRKSAGMGMDIVVEGTENNACKITAVDIDAIAKKLYNREKLIITNKPHQAMRLK